jgi:hypothetical protein
MCYLVADSAHALFHGVRGVCFTFSSGVSFAKTFSAKKVLAGSALDLCTADLTLLTSDNIFTALCDLKPYLLS